ncbi:MAG: hypothetical protein WBF89_14650 [Steroidobacteraceae bacterium]
MSRTPRALRMALLLCCAMTLSHAPAASAADPAAASLPDVTVIAPRPPTPQELAGEAVPHFVESHATASTVLHQLTRWRTGVCPSTRGLDPGMNAFVSARIRAVAAAVGAPHQDAPECKPNVEILFTLEPQQVLDEVAKHDSRLLGFHYSQQQKKLATFTHPIQGWYVTSTRNFKGQEAIDEASPLGASQSDIGTPTGNLPSSRVPPGEPGSRLTNLRSSQVVLALIVVDANKITGMSIGALSDYLAMLALSQAKPSETCSQLPTIMDLMAAACEAGEKPDQITAGDLAFLHALYGANLETPIELEQSNIENAMMLQFHKR